MTQSNHYDFIIIGNGPAGIHAAHIAGELGKKVLIVTTFLGGTCVNFGCIPKKILWESAKLVSVNPFAQYLGISKLAEASPVGYGEVDWPAVTQTREKISGGISSLYEGIYKKLGIDVVFGVGKLTGEDAEVEVDLNKDQKVGEQDLKKSDKVTFSTNYVLIATGNQAVIPQDIPGAELGKSSDAFFGWRNQPTSAIIIGGGYIGTELASTLQLLGSKVTLAIRHDKLLRRFDELIQHQVTAATEQLGVNLKKNVTVAKIEQQGGLKKVHFSDGSSEEAEEVLWTIGRKPQTTELGLKEAGVKVGATGGIEVDGYNKTSNPKVYAAGDVLDKVNLTPVASRTGSYIPRRLFGHAKIPVYNFDQPTPAVIFSHPEVATLGLSSKEAEEKFGKDNVKVYEEAFPSSFYIVAPQDKQKHNHYKYITAGEHEKIVGLHLIGDNATEEIQGYVLALKLGATRRDLLDTIFVHPTVAEWKHHDF